MKNQKHTPKPLLAADLTKVAGGNGSGNNPIEYPKKKKTNSELFTESNNVSNES